MLLRLSRSSRTVLLLGLLTSLVLFPLVFLTDVSTNGLKLSFVRLSSSGGRGRIPSAMVLKGTLVGKGLDWPSRLMEDQFYFTAGNIGGVTNHIISYTNTIYIALLTSRVPIVPPIYPYTPQLGGDLITRPLHDLPFSAVFDLPRLFDHLHKEHGLRGIIEWHELVNFTKGYEPEGWNATTDWVDVACWAAHTPGLPDPLNRLRIRPTFSNLPPLTLPTRPQISIPTLTSYLHPDSPIIQSYLDAINGTVETLPSTKLACIDNAYYAHNTRFVASEWAGEGGLEVGAWPVVGRHMHWTPELKARGETVARWLFGTSPSGEPVDYISVHIRHGDFLRYCPPPPPPNSTTVQHCWSSAQYAYAVETLKKSIFWETGKSIDQVLFTTDEMDPKFLREITEKRGWKTVNEELSMRIRREWGDWEYPTLIDNVLLSRGKGFVGTQTSTMSIINARRVECQSVRYCSRDHQRAHWKIHKMHCFAIEWGPLDLRGRLVW
ncbi:hypothetical protein BDY24DRAFT_417997 [Mrakia frigida]|uniref:uncharacterized protein n=1 Tax=Mrakia frigida TaxID=29902 RepID=UPI003FCC207C